MVRLCGTKRGNPRGFNPRWIHDETWGIQATCNGGCNIAGTGDEYGYSALDGVTSDVLEAYIVKIDSSGNVQWEESYSSDDFGLKELGSRGHCPYKGRRCNYCN